MYLIIGLPAFIILGAIWAWADTRGKTRIAKPLLPILLATFPTLILAGVLDVAGSIGQ